MTVPEIAPVVRTVTLRTDPVVAFAVFTDRISDWWPLATHTPAESLSQGLAFVDGELIETQADGARESWGAVSEWNPPSRLAFDWHPGGGPVSRISVDFEQVVDGTRVVLTHVGWQAYGDRAQLVRDNYESPQAWPFVLGLYEARADGAKDAQSGYDISALRAGYEAIALALAVGSFVEPPAGEWHASQVAGHVATNADAMCRVVDGVRGGRPVRLHGPDDHLPEAVDRFADQSFGDVATAVRMAGAALVARCAGLTEADLETSVPVYIEHHGEPVMDGDWPLGQMLGAQVAMHLPAHVEQIRDLTSG